MLWNLYNQELNSRMILGSALYPSLEKMIAAIKAAEVDMVTVALKRQLSGGSKNFVWETIQKSTCKVLPNTAGCRTVQESVTIAEMAREIFNTNFIKLEIIGDDYTLAPNIIELVKATEILINKGFKVLPYCTDDLVVAKELVLLGCEVLMPLASPIGSGQGLRSQAGLQLLRERFPDTKLIVDAGIGTPSDAVIAMEMGYDGVLLNSAVALADQPVKMALAFSQAIKAGRLAYEARRMPKREFASPSTALSDTPFWHQSEQVKEHF